MTNRSIELEAALRLALEALERCGSENYTIEREAITAIKAVLASKTDCTRSHPHENMSKECELRTEIARLENMLTQPALASEQRSVSDVEPVAKVSKRYVNNIHWLNEVPEVDTLLYTTPPQPNHSAPHGEPVAWLDPQGNVTQIPFSKRYRGYTPLYAGAPPTQCLHCLQRSKDEL